MYGADRDDLRIQFGGWRFHVSSRSSNYLLAGHNAAHSRLKNSTANSAATKAAYSCHDSDFSAAKSHTALNETARGFGSGDSWIARYTPYVSISTAISFLHFFWISSTRVASSITWSAAPTGPT